MLLPFVGSHISATITCNLQATNVVTNTDCSRLHRNEARVSRTTSNVAIVASYTAILQVSEQSLHIWGISYSRKSIISSHYGSTTSHLKSIIQAKGESGSRPTFFMLHMQIYNVYSYIAFFILYAHSALGNKVREYIFVKIMVYFHPKVASEGKFSSPVGFDPNFVKTTYPKLHSTLNNYSSVTTSRRLLPAPTCENHSKKHEQYTPLYFNIMS